MPGKLYNSQHSERIHYFNGLRILVGGTKQVENEKLHQEIDTDLFRSKWNSMIWLELQVSYCFSLSDKDFLLVNMRKHCKSCISSRSV